MVPTNDTVMAQFSRRKKINKKINKISTLEKKKINKKINKISRTQFDAFLSNQFLNIAFIISGVRF